MEIQNQINGGEEEIKNKMKKKRSRGMHVIRIVLYMLRRSGKSKPLNKGFWRRSVGSIQQLKNDNIMIMSSSNISTLPPSFSPASNEDQLSEMVDVFTATSSSSSSGISGYESAKSLRDMDCLDEDDDDDDDDDDECYGDVDGGDEMIDEKAEEFIERFYEQMRMQNQAFSGRYKAKEMIVV